MTKVSFELGTDSSDFLNGFRTASNAVTGLSQETIEYGDLSRKVFKANAEEVDKYSKELTEGAKQTTKMREEANNLGKTANIVKQLKQQIKEYTSEAFKAGEGTKAFKENLEKAGKLKDQLADLNAQVNSLNGNLGENLARAAGNSLGLVARGFEGASSVSVLLGENTKEFEETLLKLQAFNGLANVAQEFAGISDKITEIKLGFAPVADAFKGGASSIVSSYSTANESLRGFFSNFLGNSKAALKGGVDFVKNFGSNAVSVAKSAGAGFVGFFTNFGTNMKGFAASAKSGINTIGTAIKKNPLGIILTAVIAISAAFIVMRDKIKPIADLFEFLGELWDDAVELLTDIGEALGFIADEEERRRDAAIENAKDEINAIKGRYDYEIQLLEASGKETIKKEREKSDAVKARIKQQILDLSRVQAIEGKLTDDQVKLFKEAQEEYVQAVRDRTILEAKYAKDIADKEKEEQKKRQDAAKQAAEKRKQLSQDLVNSLSDLAKKAQAAQLEGLTGKDRLDKQKEIAEQELQILRDVIEKKGKLLDSNFKFTKEQEEQFNTIENRIVQEHAQGIIKIESEKAAKLAEIQSKENSDALKQLELKAKIQEDSIKAIPKPGNLTKDQEAQFELEKQKQLLQVRKQFLQQSLDLKTQEINARANAEIVALQNEKAALEKNTDEVSRIKVEAINRDIEAIKEGASLEKDAIVAETKATVQGINDELGKIGEQTKPKKLDINKILGLDSGEISSALKQFGEKNQIDIKVSPESIDATKAAVQQLISSLKELVQAYFDAQNEALDQELKANQERIDARDQNIQDLRDKMQEEEALRDQGLANNVDRIKAELEAQEAAKQQDLIREKQIKEEKRKLAKQQLIIDTAMQASQMVLAIAQLFAQGSSFWVGPVPVGLIVAGLAATAMTAAFIAGKKKAFDAVNSNAAQLYTGGYVEGKGGFTGDGGKFEPAGVVHGGEYVMNKETTDDNWALLHGLHTGDKRMMEMGVRDLIKDKGIYLASDIPAELSKTKNAVRNAEMKAFFNVDNTKLEKRMEAIEGHVKEIVLQGKDSTDVMPDGTRIIKSGSTTRIIRAKK